ncbi:hypothetical protein A2U01_0069478 [Trifolium medium]|uniref:Uncharacterized protein n=1 Tax=Trifolium medium TaxID=97028 RepID=A0A392SJW1_9FABA|nr:hypothetical protein [Trifolium medium]
MLRVARRKGRRQVVSLLVARRAEQCGALRRLPRVFTGGFELMHVAQIHMARRASSSLHHAYCAGSMARCASTKSI